MDSPLRQEIHAIASSAPPRETGLVYGKNEEPRSTRPPKGKLFTIECEDAPKFGETSYLELDSARTARVAIDFQIDFCSKKGYVHVMGYPLSNTANPLTFARKALADARKAGITVIPCREGHMPDLSDCPYNKILRSKNIKDAVGIGEKPKGRVGRLLLRGSPSYQGEPFPRMGRGSH
jgi:biuret amidohydrolase